MKTSFSITSSWNPIYLKIISLVNEGAKFSMSQQQLLHMSRRFLGSLCFSLDERCVTLCNPVRRLTCGELCLNYALGGEFPSVHRLLSRYFYICIALAAHS